MISSAGFNPCTLPKTNGWRAPKWWALEKVTGPLKNGNFWYTLDFWGVYETWILEFGRDKKWQSQGWNFRTGEILKKQGPWRNFLQATVPRVTFQKARGFFSSFFSWENHSINTALYSFWRSFGSKLQKYNHILCTFSLSGTSKVRSFSFSWWFQPFFGCLFSIFTFLL